jgi:hypothetical protein
MSAGAGLTVGNCPTNGNGGGGGGGSGGGGGGSQGGGAILDGGNMTYATDAIVAPTLLNGATATAVDPVNCWQTAISEPPRSATGEDGTVVTTTGATDYLNSQGFPVVQTSAGTITPPGGTSQPFQVTLSTVTDPVSGAATQYSSHQPLLNEGGALVADTGGDTVLTSDGQGNSALTQDGQLRFSTSTANQTLTTYTVENGDPVAQAVLPCGGPGALDSFWVKLRCGVLTTLSGPRHPSQVSRGRRAASAFSLLLCSPATVGL